MSYMVFIISIIVAIGFVYLAGYLYGSQKQKGKEDEREIDTIQRASAARSNASIDKLRKKYKNTK